jgi:hypothetical protein
MEFHCTAPVRPSRAQQILYGPTLKPYLYGEQIGQTLLNKASSSPLVVFTDVDAALTVRDFVDSPVAYVAVGDAQRDADAGNQLFRIDAADPDPPKPSIPGLHAFSVAGQNLAVLQTHQRDAETVSRRWESMARGFDLTEPFGRIREAIDEARRSAR